MAEKQEVLRPIHAVRENGKLWLREPQVQDEDDVIGARLCNCGRICVALVEDR